MAERERERFHRDVRGYLRALGRTQRELAHALGLHPDVLSHKLHGHGRATLTQAEVVAIVYALAAWGALATQAEARTLFAMMAVTPHALPPGAWTTPPLADLIPDAPEGAPVPVPGRVPVPAPGPAPAPPSAPISAVAAAASGPIAADAPVPGTLVGTAPAPLRPHPLPAPPTALIGRAAERTAVHAALAASRLVTLTGTGGVGKTRLALEVAHETAGSARFPDGVAFADLAPLRDPALLASALLQALGLPTQSALSAEAQLTQALHAHALLLVADNLEHLLEGTPLLGRLLAAAPRLRILATSRVPLRLYGEHEVRVPPLPLPAASSLTSDASALSAGGASDQGLEVSEAVQLFVARARAVAPGFAPAGAELAAVAAICTALDGLPLAIELAAARVKLFPPAALLPRLSARLTLLTDGPRDLPARQRTLCAALDWSYALLTPAERALFARLGVFSGPFVAAAAAAVCAPSPLDGAREMTDGPWFPDEDAGAAAIAAGGGADAGAAERMLGRLAALADQSLLEVAPGPVPRFRLLETVRAYALDRLAEDGTQEVMYDRHLRYYRALAEQGGGALAGPEQGAWLDRLEREHANLRAALTWAREGGAAAQGLRLAVALARFWEERGHVREGRAWLETLLQAAPGRDGHDHDQGPLTALRARALATTAWLAFQHGDWQGAAPLAAQSLAGWHTLGQCGNSAVALNTLAHVARHRGDRAREEALFRESLALCQAQGDTQGCATVLGFLGTLRRSLQDLDGASVLLEESLALCREVGDVGGRAYTLLHLGCVATQRRDYARAEPLFEESLTLYRELGDRANAAWVLSEMAVMAADQGEAERARTLCEDGVALFRALGNARGLVAGLIVVGRVAMLQGDDCGAAAAFAECLTLRDAAVKEDVALSLEGLAQVVVRQTEQHPSDGQMERAVRLFGAAAALRGTPSDAAPRGFSPGLMPERRREYERQVAATRAALGADAFAAAWAEGEAWPEEQALDDALDWLAAAQSEGAAPPPAIAVTHMAPDCQHPDTKP